MSRRMNRRNFLGNFFSYGDKDSLRKNDIQNSLYILFLVDRLHHEEDSDYDPAHLPARKRSLPNDFSARSGPLVAWF